MVIYISQANITVFVRSIMGTQGQRYIGRPPSGRRRIVVVTRIPILVVVSLQLLLVILLCGNNLIGMVHAQRAIVSLGSKLQKSDRKSEIKKLKNFF